MQPDGSIAIDHNTKKSKNDAMATTEILKKLILRRIVKENHGRPIKHIAFNFTSPCNANLVATVGANQANIYDNENCGSHLDIMCNYPYPDKSGQVLNILLPKIPKCAPAYFFFVG